MVARRGGAGGQIERNGANGRRHLPDDAYPAFDGKPMGATDTHRREIVRLFETLEDAFAADPLIYVSADLLTYYERDNIRAVIVPDVFVTVGVPKGNRRTYLLWREGKPPTMVIEVSSPSTRKRDHREKRQIYPRLGVAEYVLYDPLGERSAPALQVERLVDGAFVPVQADAEGAFASHVLTLRYRLVDGRLQIFDTRTGEMLHTPAERLARENETLSRQNAALLARIAELERMQRDP